MQRLSRIATSAIVALVVLLAVTVQPLAFAIEARAQDDARTAEEAGAAADFVLGLAADRSFNALYDWIHPEAHAVVPRVTAVRLFQQVYEVAQAGRGRVTGVRLIEWTWEVTGKTYPDAAGVSYEQPYAEDGEEKLLREVDVPRPT